MLVGVESGSNEVLRRIRKDIKIEQVYETAEKMLKYGIAGQFPFIVGFPDETRCGCSGKPRLRQAIARDESADFPTPIFYFKPYPGSELVTEAVARGFRLPETLEAWAEFDYRRRRGRSLGLAGKIQTTSNASNSSMNWHGRGCRPANVCCRKLARYRCDKDDYRWPVEMLFTRWLVPRPALS